MWRQRPTSHQTGWLSPPPRSPFLSCWFFWNSFAGSPYVAKTSLKFTIPLSLLSECWDYCQVPSYLDSTSLLELSMMVWNLFLTCAIQKSLALHMGLHILNGVSVAEEPHFKIDRLLFVLNLNINRLTWPVTPMSGREGPLGSKKQWKKQERRVGVYLTPKGAHVFLPVINSGVKPKTASHITPHFLFLTNGVDTGSPAKKYRDH